MIIAMRIVGVLLAAAVLATAAGCRDGDDETASGPRPVASAAGAPSVPAAATGRSAVDPCALVTAAEIKAATGTAYGTGRPTGGLVAYCKYQAGDEVLVVEAYPSGDAGVYQRAIDGAASVSGGTVTAVGGIGDRAGYVARAGTLCVHRGTENLCIVGPGRAADLTLARAALGRM
jgi:hypothetical protein